MTRHLSTLPKTAGEARRGGLHSEPVPEPVPLPASVCRRAIRWLLSGSGSGSGTNWRIAVQLLRMGDPLRDMHSPRAC